MKRPVLCATDFSASAIRMSDAAAGLAAKLGVPLVLVHVRETYHAAEPDFAETLRVAARDRLRQEAGHLRERGIEVDERLLDGSPHEAILALCDELPVRLIMMASREDRVRPARWFFGGVVKNVIVGAKVPTLVVRDAAVIEEWLAGREPLRVFVAVNLSSFSDIPLLWVKQLAAIAPCDITVAYLNWIPDEVLRLGLAHVSLFEGSRELQAMLEHELRDRSREILGELPFRIRVEPRQGCINLPLIEMAQRVEADLFVVGTRLRTGFSRIFEEAVSVDILHKAPMGVAVVPLLETVVTVPTPVLERVLVPTDFTDEANFAIRYACSIVAPGGTVQLLHITHHLGVGEHEARERLKILIPPEAEQRGIVFERIVWSDLVIANGILQAATRLRSDVICVGARSRSGLTKPALGSTLRSLLNTSLIPVLLARKPI